MKPKPKPSPIVYLIYDLEQESFVGEVFTSRTTACKRAADFFGFKSYTNAFRKGWCVVYGYHLEDQK